MGSFEAKGLIEFLLIDCDVGRNNVTFFRSKINDHARLSMQQLIADLFEAHGFLLKSDTIDSLFDKREGKEANRNVGFDALFSPVINGSHSKIVLADPERLFDLP